MNGTICEKNVLGYQYPGRDRHTYRRPVYLDRHSIPDPVDAQGSTR